MSQPDKTVYKIGDMIIDNKQIFWKMKYCYALIPIVQLLDGHVLLVPKRQVAEFSQLQPVEVFDITLTLKLLSRAMESFYACNASTIHIQNSSQQGVLKHLIIHIIPRKANDVKSREEIYQKLSTYPEDLLKHYNEKMNFYINAYANKILQGLNEQARKYESHVTICFKEENLSLSLRVWFEATISNNIFVIQLIMHSNKRVGLAATDFPQNHFNHMLSQKTGINNHQSQAESSKEIKHLKLDHSPNERTQNRQRLNHSDIYISQRKRKDSPLLYPTLNQNETYLSGLEKAILEENRNIKQHNNFLKGQIKLMFQREKKHKHSLNVSKQKIKQLEGINKHLQNQLQLLFSSIVGEIERIQRIIEEQKFNNFDDLLMISRSLAETPLKSVEIGSETQSTIHNNLEDLKHKVAKMAKYNHADHFREEDLPKFQSPLSNQQRDALSHKFQSIITKQNSVKETTYLQVESEDFFEAYLPTKLIANEKRESTKRITHRNY